MKQKKPKAEIILESENKDVDILVADPKEVEKYLKNICITQHLGTKEEKIIYAYIRDSLTKSLNQKSKADVVFAALIERIARTAVLLNRTELVLLSMKGMAITSQTKKGQKSDYILLQQEHRKCLETFANLRFAEGRKNKTKVLEELRRSIEINE